MVICLEQDANDLHMVQLMPLFKQIVDGLLSSHLSMYCCSRFCSAICQD